MSGGSANDLADKSLCKAHIDEAGKILDEKTGREADPTSLLRDRLTTVKKRSKL